MIHHLDARKFDEASKAALKDRTLNGALARATDLVAGRLQTAIKDVPEWEVLREKARAIKERTLRHLDSYLEQFEARATESGAHVHWARDGEEACAIVSRIAVDHAARRIVKSKSMTTEEIGLNDALARAIGLPVETDLGEWIIQLAGETPSHIILPAIHKTREQIARLFADHLGTDPDDDAAALTATARGRLRQLFARADLGISGANFAIAETGGILILENEGNARLTTSLPRTHVAVVGIEKVIPEVADLEVFLRLLPRAGTGQHLTTYQSILTGPEVDGEGPEEVHIVLLDNGRSEMLASRVTRQSLACIRCGACLNACPVYKQVGGHAYGSVYPGPIGAVITPQLAPLEEAAKLPYASSLCGACRDVCPVKIDIPELLLHLRSEITEGQDPGSAPRKRASIVDRAAFGAWAWAMSDARRYRFAMRMARWFRGLWQPVAGRPSGVGAARAWTSGREWRPIADRSLRDMLADRQRSER